MTIAFLVIVGISLNKFNKRSIGETQKTKKAEEMYLPSIALCPLFLSNYSALGTKNLTEYYIKRKLINDNVLSIRQHYVREDG